MDFAVGDEIIIIDEEWFGKYRTNNRYRDQVGVILSLEKRLGGTCLARLWFPGTSLDNIGLFTYRLQHLIKGPLICKVTGKELNRKDAVRINDEIYSRTFLEEIVSDAV